MEEGNAPVNQDELIQKKLKEIENEVSLKISIFLCLGFRKNFHLFVFSMDIHHFLGYKAY